MSAEQPKQVTVAELMARARQEGQGAQTPPRRRRRSVEEGGVTVAELTGNIPKVNSRPAQPKHGVPLDAAPAPAPAPAQRPASRPQPAARPGSANPAPNQAVQNPAAAAAAPASADSRPTTEVPLNVVPGGSRPRLTTDTPRTGATGSFPAQHTGAFAAQSKTASPVNVPAGRTAAPRPPAAMAAAESKATAATPAQPKKPEVPPVAAPAPRAAQPVAVKAAAPEVKPADTPAPELKARPTGSLAPEVQAAVAASPVTEAETSVIQVVPETESGPLNALPASLSADPALEAAAELDPEVEPAKINWLAVLIMVLIGVAIGAGLFLGFVQLWSHFSPIVTAIFALAVTGGIVGGVHALRTERDGMSMVLAGLAGLACTFGPVAITGLG